MATAKVTFRKCLQDSQDYGSDDEHMVSRVFFDLTINGEEYGDCYADIKQTVGSSFETGVLEVSRPQGYSGPFNFAEFRKAAEAYYRSLVGARGGGIRIQGGGNIRMHNNLFVKLWTVEFDIGKSGVGW